MYTHVVICAVQSPVPWQCSWPCRDLEKWDSPLLHRHDMYDPTDTQTSLKALKGPKLPDLGSQMSALWLLFLHAL